MIGRTISHYRILEELGRGGMGVVYKAEDKKLRRNVALKFLPSELTSDQGAKERFIHEAQAASALDHPNICTVYEVNETHDGSSFIAMAYYDGETLKKKIERGPLKVEDAIDIALQVAQGLDKVHQNGIVHRDIKPANIIVTNDGIAKIVDFGLAKLAGLTKLTRTGATVGTAAYMSPEQARGDAVDHRTDIWSLGVMLYEMLTGQLPFKSEYEQAMVYSILNEEPKPLSSLRNDVPKGYEQVVNKAMMKKTEDRYQSIHEMFLDLQAVKEGQTITKGKIRHRVKRWQLLVAGLVIVTLVVLVLSVLFQSKNIAHPRKSIAILPFKSLSDSKEDEYFSDGITEDILIQLSKIADLRVISSAATRKYKGSNKNIRDICRELEVSNVLEGSVRRSGDQVRIVAQLINANDESNIWADTYDKQWSQIFSIQSDVAQKISSALRVTLLPNEKSRIEIAPTENLDAYAFYLKGRELYYRYKKDDNEKAIQLFRKAIGLDSNYALACAGLADAYCMRFWRWGHDKVLLDTAFDLSNRAISLAPELAEGYKALGLVYEYRGGKVNKAIESYRRAIELNPNYWPAVTNLGNLFLFTGRLDQAVFWDRKSITLNISNPAAYGNIADAWTLLCVDSLAERYYKKKSDLRGDQSFHGDLSDIYLRQGKLIDARSETEKALSIDSTNWGARWNAGLIYLIRGENQKALKLCGVDSILLGYLYWKTGKQHIAQGIFDRKSVELCQLLQEGNESSHVPVQIGIVYAIQGQKEKAFYYLNKAIEFGYLDYRQFQIWPMLESLRNNDQFKQMIAQMKSKVVEQRKKVEEMDKAENQ